MYTGYFVPWNTGTIYGCFVTNFLVGITLDNQQLFKPIKSYYLKLLIDHTKHNFIILNLPLLFPT